MNENIPVGPSPDTDSVAPAPPPPPPEPAAPVGRRDRIHTLDLLRGFALLGILGINVWAYGMPFPAAMNPYLMGWATPLDRVMYAIVHMTVYMKTMPIFSMLFGAGILLLATRMEDRGRKPGRFVLRRQFWLLVFGLIHAYFLWAGDILVPYALVGLGVYLLRRRRPRTLLILACIGFLIPKLIAHGGGWYMQGLETRAAEYRAAEAAGDTLTDKQATELEMLEENSKGWNPSREDIDELIEVKRGPYPAFLAHNAKEVAMMHLAMYPLYVNWNLAGFMLLGMMLFKTGVLTGERSAGFYRRLLAWGYGLGVPLNVVCLVIYHRTAESFPSALRWGFPLVEISGPLIALGRIALLVLAFKRGWLTGLQIRLRAVGRMAFTNYIAHTVICTLIFHGYGLAQWGAWNRSLLMLLVLAVWALQLWWSPWWLARYRFGPLEWLWRSLTYRARQPFRV